MIVTHQLSKQFADFPAVQDIHLRVGAGQVLALLGPNGAGKTTTVRMLASVLAPTHGWARVAGFDTVAQAGRVRAVIGVLTEQHGLYTRMRAEEYLDFFGQVYRVEPPRRKQRIRELLEELGLAPFRRRRVGEYSKGMRQKLSLARTLLHDPPVLLLDEPTSAMDPESARLVRDAIRALRSAERTIVICTHNLAEAEELADRIAIIRLGTIIAQGTGRELKEQLLGPPEYELRLAEAVEIRPADLPPGVDLLASRPGWVCFRSSNPAEYNPAVLRRLLDAGLPVLSLEEAPRSLEQVYLQAMHGQEVVHDG